MGDEGRVREIRTDTYSYVFGTYGEPVATVRPGEIVDIYTEDAFESRVQDVDDLPSQVLTMPFLNPQTGPIVVEGARKGDTLAVEILEIEPTRDFVVSAHIPNFGGLTGTSATALLTPSLPEQVYKYPLRDGHVELPRGIRLPYRPFVGTIATAPELEAIGALTPGPFGGNMDVPDTCPGNIVRLPVNVDGAWFFTGDAHASQGDGELCGVACEMTARVRVRFGVESGATIAWPRIESPTEIMTVGSARPMEDAARIAWVELIRWMQADYGFEELEAYQLLTHAGRMRVGNMVDPQYSLVAKIDKSLLGS
ncbi:acetamidase [Baekduia soli]|uniref:Acetamidase n=1 Tax=Baekduia soli TaxID=496014 RepID=A0A5B8U3D3_9ACTN|nr:acetamidase/formamidase family protein [Baekduia soli]QEC47567.1 acetamidase [Baekduia soli]